MHAGLPLLLQVVVAPDWPSYTATWRPTDSLHAVLMCWIVDALLAFFSYKM